MVKKKEKDMKKNIKKKDNGTVVWLTYILIGLIIIFVAVLAVVNWLDNEKKEPANEESGNSENIIYNNNEGVVGDKMVGDVVFTNIECSFDGYRSLLKYTVINNGDSNIILGDYEIVVRDSEKNVIAVLVPGSTQVLKAKESLDTGNVIDTDLSDVDSIELKLSE